MTLEHLTTFAGLPVVDFDGPDDYPDAADGELAWRVSVASWDPKEPYDEMFVRFLEEVETESVEAFVIGCWGFSDETSAELPVDLLCGAARWFPALRAVFVGDMVTEESEISWINQTDVTPLLETYPGLEILRTRGGHGLGLRPVRHERLRHLGFESGGLPGAVVRAAGAAELPALEHLELWLGAQAYGADGDLTDLDPILAGGRWPGLRYLGLADAEQADEIAARVGVAPVLDGLETLDLSKGTLTDAGARALLDADAVRKLRRLDLRYHYLSEEMAERLRATLGASGVEVDVSGRREPGRYENAAGEVEVSRTPAVTE